MDTDQLFTEIERHLASMDRSKAWLAEQLGTTTQVINNWRNRRIPKDRIEEIAGVFGWSYSDLLKGLICQEEDNVQIPLYNVEGGMAGGKVAPDHEIVISSLQLSRRWLAASLIYTKLSNLKLMTGRGNSMHPTFSDGAALLVDVGINTIDGDGVYVLLRDGEIFIKRLEKMVNNRIQVSSDNPDYKAYTILKSELFEISIVGKVIWAFTGKPL